MVVYTLFLRVLTSCLRGSDNGERSSSPGERFVIPAEAGGKRRLRSSFYYAMIIKNTAASESLRATLFIYNNANPSYA